MSLVISKDYLKGTEKDETSWPLYIIAPPENVPELAGYVLKISQKDVTVTDTMLQFRWGNKWDGKQRESLYIFEKEIRDPGQRYKRYKYTEAEVTEFYEKAQSLVLKKRAQAIAKGPGKLLRASYKHKGKGNEADEGWFFTSDADQKWAYPLDYDPLQDLGKHKKKEKGFSVLEEYTVRDIAILHESREMLSLLLRHLDVMRNLRLDYDTKEMYRGRDAVYKKAETLGEDLAIKCYNAIPIPITHKRYRKTPAQYETPEGEQLRKELTALGMEMERKCSDAIRQCQIENIEKIAVEIKNLIDVEITKAI